MRIALIKDSIVINIIEATDSFIEDHFENLNVDFTVDISDNTFVDIGYQYIDAEFVAPASVEEIEE